MKRINALQPISHQHHNALMGCLMIKKGIKKRADKKVLRDFTLRFFESDIQSNMKAEEQFVLPYVENLELPYRKMMERDHETIRLLADRLRINENGYQVYATFADILEQHIRFEERVVFNKLQDNLSNDEETRLGSSLKNVTCPKCTDYPVKFWE